MDIVVITPLTYGEGLIISPMSAEFQSFGYFQRHFVCMESGINSIFFAEGHDEHMQKVGSFHDRMCLPRNTNNPICLSVSLT